MWSRANDNFVTVCFPNVATLDVLWKSLEIIDEEYLKRVKERNAKWLEELKTAKNVELNLGPKGGFRSLSFEYMSDVMFFTSINMLCSLLILYLMLRSLCYLCYLVLSIHQVF